MALKNIEPDKLKEWHDLNNHYESIKNKSISYFFEADKKRFDSFSINFKDMLVDFSKNLIDETTLKLLIKLANKCELKDAIKKLFCGDKINQTENRSVKHTYLRDINNIFNSPKQPYTEISNVLKKMKTFTEDVLSEKWKGYTNKPITDIISIGIGGSDLGNRMFCNALDKKKDDLRFHFLSNIDSDEVNNILKNISPETSLFIVLSKTFTTLETITNFNTCKKWFLNHSQTSDLSKHFIGVTTNKTNAIKSGISKENIFEFWEWAGGRYSIWSSIGLPTCLYAGYEEFIEILSGANDMDIHFREAPFEKNIPILLALISIWNINFLGYKSQSILPYENKLGFVVNYLQQLYMESNGKNCNRDGKFIKYDTCPTIYGDIGINGQHSFFQYLHQGTNIVACDFIISLKEKNNLPYHRLQLLANSIAQTRSLAMGKRPINEEKINENGIDLSPFRTFHGNRPSNSIILKDITPKTLGALISMYEHKVFSQGIIWNIYSYDQWGVELGKELAKDIFTELNKTDKTEKYDDSTNGLINFYKNYIQEK